MQVRKPFEYRDQVPWCEVAAVLTALFQQNTGRALDEDQLNYLARMAFSTLLLLIVFLDNDDDDDDDRKYYVTGSVLYAD